MSNAPDPRSMGTATVPVGRATCPSCNNITMFVGMQATGPHMIDPSIDPMDYPVQTKWPQLVPCTMCQFRIKIDPTTGKQDQIQWKMIRSLQAQARMRVNSLVSHAQQYQAQMNQLLAMSEKNDLKGDEPDWLPPSYAEREAARAMLPYKADGHVIGFRAWSLLVLRPESGDPEVVLTSLQNDDIIWKPGEPMCGVHHRDMPGHRAAGIYAFRWGYQTREMIHYTGQACLAFGHIALWGEVVEHEYGYRARWGYPTSITIPEHVGAFFKIESRPTPGGRRFNRFKRRGKSTVSTEAIARDLADRYHIKVEIV